MANRKMIKSALRGFLGTYTSRYSDYRGYWLFGFLVEGLSEVSFDLLNGNDRCVPAPMWFAEHLAATRFEEQVRKAGLSLDRLMEARLTVRRGEAESRTIYGHARHGFTLSFNVHAILDNGRTYDCEQATFVAPHDPSVEMRRDRDQWIV